MPAEEFYTFDAKYKNAESRVVIPAEIEHEKQEEIKKLAIKAFKAVDGKGLSRVDFFIKKSDNKVYKMKLILYQDLHKLVCIQNYGKQAE